MLLDIIDEMKKELEDSKEFVRKHFAKRIDSLIRNMDQEARITLFLERSVCLEENSPITYGDTTDRDKIKFNLAVDLIIECSENSENPQTIEKILQDAASSVVDITKGEGISLTFSDNGDTFSVVANVGFGHE